MHRVCEIVNIDSGRSDIGAPFLIQGLEPWMALGEPMNPPVETLSGFFLFR